MDQLTPGTTVRPKAKLYAHLGVGTVVRTDPEMWGEPPEGYPIPVVFVSSSCPYHFAAADLDVIG